MQFTQEFIQLDGTPNKAVISARKTKLGFVGVVKIGRLSKTVTAPNSDSNDALTGALRCLLNYKENSII